MPYGDTGLVGTAWGAGTAVMGLVLATDYRGAAHWMEFRRPSVFGVRGVRWVGAVFAVVGPVVLVTSAATLAGHGFGERVHSRAPVPWPVLVFAAGICASVLWGLWRPGGPFRRLWDGGGRMCRSALVVQGAALTAFVVSLGFANLTGMLTCWLTALLAALTAVLSRHTRD